MLPTSSVANTSAAPMRVSPRRVLTAIMIGVVMAPLPAFSTGKYQQEPIIKREAVYVTDHKHDGAAYALVGAGITYWLWHRYHKKHPKIITVVEKPEPLVCEPTTDVRIERIYEACVSK